MDPDPAIFILDLTFKTLTKVFFNKVFCSLLIEGTYDLNLFFVFLLIVLRWSGPRPHISFPPDLILYVNLIAMGPVHLSPVTWPQALRYWYSLTPLMHIVAQLGPIDLHNFLGQIPESSQILGASKLPLLV